VKELVRAMMRQSMAVFDLCPSSGPWSMNLHDVVARSSEGPAQIVVVSSKHDLLARLLEISARLTTYDAHGMLTLLELEVIVWCSPLDLTRHSRGTLIV